MIFNGSVTLIGATKDHFKLLAADVGEWAASGDIATVGNVPSITLDAMPTGWKDNDLITIAPTGRTYSHWDTALLNGDPGSAVVNVDGWQGVAPLYNAGVATKSAWNHQGAGTPTQARAEVLNLTRNVKIYSTNAALRTYVSIGATATVTMNYVEVYTIGFNGAGKYGITLATAFAGTAGFTGVVVHDSNWNAWLTSSNTGTITGVNCIGWAVANSHVFNISAAMASTSTWTSCIAGNWTTSGKQGWYIKDAGSSFPSSRAIGGNDVGFLVTEDRGVVIDGFLDNAVSHSNSNMGFLWSGIQIMSPATALDGLISWRNGAAGGVYGFDQTYTSPSAVWLTNPIMFGNWTAQIVASAGAVYVSNPTDDGESATYTTPTLSNIGGRLTVTGGIIRGKPVNIGAGAPMIVDDATWNSFAPPTVFDDLGDSTSLIINAFNHDPLDNRAYYKYGNVLSNSVTRHTPSGLSSQHLPIGGVNTWFRPNQSYQAQVEANIQVTVNAWVYVDGAYNGTAKPRIVILGGKLQGIPNDVIGSSHSGTVGLWEKLSATATPTAAGTLEFVIEGQGTAPGSYYVDDEGSVVPAFVPLAPTVNATSDSSLTVIINPNGNIDSTEYAISCDNDATFLNHTTNACEAIADDTDHWRPYANWGGDSGFADTGLLASSTHTYKVKARYGNKVETALSGGTAQTTLAAPPAPGGGSSFSLLAPSHISQKLFNSLKTADAEYRTAVDKATKEFQAAIKAAKTANERKEAVGNRNRAIHDAYLARTVTRQLAMKTYLSDLAAWRREQESIINVYKKTVKSTISQYQDNKKSVLGAYKTNFELIKQTPGNVTEKGNLYKTYSEKMIQTRKEFQSAFQSALKSYLLSLKAHYL